MRQEKKKDENLYYGEFSMVCEVKDWRDQGKLNQLEKEQLHALELAAISEEEVCDNAKDTNCY